MDQILINILNGVSSGLLLFMLSSGLTLIFSMMGVLNFAHASFYMIGAYFAYTLTGVLGFWPALLVAPLAVGALGAGSVVPPGKVLDSGYLYVGSPAKRVRPLSERERDFLGYSPQNYQRLKDRHQALLA